MKLRCQSNAATTLPASYLDPRAGLDRNFVFPLTVGEAYVVYALLFRRDGVWYQLCDDNDLPYPMAYPAPLFELTSGKLSRYWTFALTPQHADHLAILAISEWAQDRFFYDRLTDGSREDVAVFARARGLMDREELSPQLSST